MFIILSKICEKLLLRLEELLFNSTMIQRKYVPMGTAYVGIVFSLLLFAQPRDALFPYFPLFKYEMNCSVYCTCRDSTLESTMKQYNHKHLAIMGEVYRPEIQHFDTKSDYMTFLGVFVPILHNIARVSCELSDGQAHPISSLLNGVDKSMYTALEVKCKRKESIIWDIPAWHTSFNIFFSEQCNVSTNESDQLIIIPMNLWIVDIAGGGDHVVDSLDLKFTLNTLSLVLSGSRSRRIPNKWSSAHMCSATLLSLKDNWLEDFDCAFTFTKRLDTLNLEGNVITRFPECLLDSSYVSLNYLTLAHNQIYDISPIYDSHDSPGIPDIYIINLSYNSIGDIDSIRDMGQLRVLDLSHNKIRNISSNAFVNLKYLRKLILSNNRLLRLDLQMFLPNSRLETLDVSHNFILAVNEGNLVNLSRSTLELDVRYNRLSNPPLKDCTRVLANELNLRILSAYNPYVCDCSIIDFETCIIWLEKQNHSSSKNVFHDLGQMKCSLPPTNKGIVIRDLNFHRHCVITEECPPSCTCYLQEGDTLKVNCSSRKLLEMPAGIPNVTHAATILYLDHNPLQVLNYQPYLSQLYELYMDNCLLSAVTPGAIAALRNIRVLTLHNNMLQKLPTSTRNITMDNAINITLHNNRWACSCESLWLPRWISKHKSALWAPGNIICDYIRKPLEDLSETDLNCKSSAFMDNFLASCLLVCTLVSTALIMICYRKDVRSLLYSKLGLRVGHGFTYGDCFSPYDVFVSYSQDNYKWVVDVLVPYLECGPKKYRLCLHHRDFPSNESVLENLPLAIGLSRCSILVLSKDFIRKEWSIMEVRAAFQRFLLVGSRLIIIAIDNINVGELSPDLRAYINTHDYLRYEEPSFWTKLEMFLPPKQNSAAETAADDSSLVAGGDFVSKSCDKCEETEGTDFTEAM
ncbi:hypothetical protein Btru_068454 [Bulinus truncatus]|nr:hypothetical protein Btru_068454 [Bulinus truncatus]